MTRSPPPGAERRAGDSGACRQTRAMHAAEDQETPIGGETPNAEIDRAAQPSGWLQWLLQRTPDIGGARHRHENEPHCQQDLVQLLAAIETAVEQALDRNARQ